MSDTLTPAERELLKSLSRGPAFRTAATTGTITDLEVRGLVAWEVDPRNPHGSPIAWAITAAGREAMVEAEVAERCKEIEGLCGPRPPGTRGMATWDQVQALARIVRDQERRLVRLEMERGSVAD